MQRDGFRYFTAYMSTTLVYICLLVWMYYTPSNHFVFSKKPKVSVMQISLSTFVPPVVSEVKKSIESKPKIEKEVIVEKKPLLKPMVKKIKKNKVVEKVKKPKKRQKHKKSLRKKTLKKKTSKKEASKQQKSTTLAQKNKFWNALRRQIDAHKFYPRIAKKRGMQGSVKVSFTILSNGTLGTLSVKGPKVFHTSAKNAVKSIFPVNVKKIDISFPASSSIVLHYQIR